MNKKTKEELKKENEELKVEVIGYRNLQKLSNALIDKLQTEKNSYKDILQDLVKQLQEMTDKM